MKYFRVVFLPNGRQDKEWMMWRAENIEQLKKFFNAGTIIEVKEVSKEEYEEYLD